MDLNNFKGVFGALLKPTHYCVYGFGASRDLEFMCKAAQLPGTVLGVIEVPYMGRKVKIAGDRTYAEWAITVMNTESFDLRNYFEEWVEKINHPETNVGVANPNEYKEDGYIDQLDHNGNVLATYKLVGAFPTDISPIEMSFETTDTVAEFTISLNYDYFTRSK